MNLPLFSIGTATDNIASLQTHLNALTYRRPIITHGSGGYAGDSGNGGSASGCILTNFPDDKKTRHGLDFNVEPKRKVYHNTNYYHTYGYHITDIHTLATCKNPVEGHNTTTTRTNNMEGCTRCASI